jgi:hypothetical protein
VGLGNYLGIYLMAGGGSEDPTVLMKISLTFVEFDCANNSFNRVWHCMPFLDPKKDK